MFVRNALATGAALLAIATTGIAATDKPPKHPPLRSHPGFAVLRDNCFRCHGEGAKHSGLDLHTRDGALKGGTRGPALVPGQASKSRLFLLASRKQTPHMPPVGEMISRDLKQLELWINAGAPYPAPSITVGPQDKRWWAFRPVKRPRAPETGDASAKDAVDLFIHSRLEAAGLRPNPPADRATLLRRAILDLHGLPPTPEEVAAFENDSSPDAWEKVVDRLLASPRYGERQARFWLDLARFAESEGFKADEPRPNAWRYRDYVIDSFNADKPYDRFLKEQIAGDEMAPDDPAALVATGFNRHWADESNARNLRLRRQEILNDITDTVGTVVLGMTVACARCHDHKYDDITQKDYYQLQAFFAAVQPREDIPLVPGVQLAEYRERLARWETETSDVRARLAAAEAPYRKKLMVGKRMPFPPEVQEAIDTPASQRTALQWQLWRKVEPQLEIKREELANAMSKDDRAAWTGMEKELARFDPLKPQPLPLGLGVTDIGPVAPKTHVLSVGIYDSPLAEVQPGFPAAMTKAVPTIQAPAGMATTGRRTALADWLASPQNPLTARVAVNRLWQQHFGRGLVESSGDFGRMGTQPTHPELLDWLADELVGGGWRLKRLHRIIMMSATYRMSSTIQSPKSKVQCPSQPAALVSGGAGDRNGGARRVTSARSPVQAQGAMSRLDFGPGALDTANSAVSVDPTNRLLWHYPRWRMEGEALRDACLAVSGELNLKAGGPSIYPELPEGLGSVPLWPVSTDPAERNRRSVYVFVKRNLRYPLFEAFDFPDTHEPCTRRNVTNTPPQALMLFNSDLVLRRAQAFAARLLREASDDQVRNVRAYQLAYARKPSAEEIAGARTFLAEQSKLIAARIAAKEKVSPPAGSAVTADGAAWVDFCHALLNSNEFLYVD